MSDTPQAQPLRVVTFNVLPVAYSLVTRWAEHGGHQIVLVVTTPGPSTRRTPSYCEIVRNAPPNVDILVTTRLRKVALPLIRELQPDLIVSFTFPYRIPPELCAIPRYGAVNLHPTALPAYRGPNVARVIYEGYPLLGATLHWTEEEYDTGRILAQRTAPMPEAATPEAIMAVWPGLMISAFAEGVARAVAGEVGRSQDHSSASYAAPFTEAEHWLDLEERKQMLQRKVTGLNLLGSPTAKLRLGDQSYLVTRLDPLPEAISAAPGSILQQTDDGFIVAVADGSVRIQATPLSEK